MSLFLVLLGLAGNQDNERVSVFPEADSISGAGFDPAFIDAGGDAQVFDKLP